MKKLVIFDLDGTLMNTKPGIVSSLTYAMEKEGLPVPDDKTLDTFIGPPLEDSFHRTFDIDDEKMKQVIKVYRAHYLDGNIYKSIPYDGIFDLLSELKKRGIDSAVATYKLETMARDLLSRYHFDEYIPYIFGKDKENTRSKSDIIRICIERSGHTREEAVMFGDSSYDAIGAGDAKVDFIGALYGFGFHDRNDVMKYDNIGTVRNPMEILDLLG
ncbi:MAG: HAD hydrolase-like protein [Clostridiales bacterium]|nr:HAD hydrolase-like protein [Clostridiales bacterium]